MRKISFPLIALNFKTYAQAFGENSLRLAKIAEEVSDQFGVTIAVAPPIIDLARVAAEVEIPVFAQHVDPYEPGSHTGSIIAEDVKAAGAVGSLVNHSEHRLKLADIGMVLKRLKENKLISLLCTDTVETTKAGAALSPDILAIEPPELIGTGIPKPSLEDLHNFIGRVMLILIPPFSGYRDIYAFNSDGEDLRIVVEP